MKALVVGISSFVLATVIACASNQAPRDATQLVDVHPCEKNPFLRSVGLFGGEQPELFAAGPDLRSDPPPIADDSTRVLNVTAVDHLRDPSAMPIINKCGSSLQIAGGGEVEVTILWDDQNCPVSFDEENPEDCHSRASFDFSLEGLGIREDLDAGTDPSAALREMLVIDAYFTRELQPEPRPLASQALVAPTSDVHLVVRVRRAT
jgi:hypothetical protein